MDIREQRQREFANLWLEKKFGIILAAPRTGKCRIAIYALQTMKFPSVLIVYPDGKIKQSWIDDFEIMKYDTSRVTYSSYVSLYKHVNEKYDVIILDEIHLTSENQINACYDLLELNRVVMGLTGTMSYETKTTLSVALDLNVIATYPIEKAVNENIITDYEITVVTVPLDTRIKQYNGKTEKQKFDNVTWVIDKMVKEGKDPFFLRLQRMRIIQRSVSKKNKTISLLKEYENERMLVFCGLTKIADGLGIPSYHSKSSEKDVFERFVNGAIRQLAVCRLGNTGVTYKSLNRVLINYTDSNPENLTQKLLRCASMEYDNPEKKALITIISSNEQIELNWIHKGLNFFNSSKIRYL